MASEDPHQNVRADDILLQPLFTVLIYSLASLRAFSTVKPLRQETTANNESPVEALQDLGIRRERYETQLDALTLTILQCPPLMPL